LLIPRKQKTNGRQANVQLSITTVGPNLTVTLFRKLVESFGVAIKFKTPGWYFTKLLKQICKIFCNFKELLRSSDSYRKLVLYDLNRG